ncbi:kinase-like domain-containing protein, partial [Halteromyces radiatus]|uniref:kinase-like domain-containing protein n=1 Tax=Halteromyces radiatus TaxID=101107 RepID=UPI00221ED72A
HFFYTYTPTLLNIFTMTTILSSTLHKKYDAVTGHKFINQYKMLNEIGRGVHGKVKLAQQGDSLVAIKIIDKHSKRRQYSLLRSSSDDPLRDHERSLRREMMILRKCHHPNIIQLLEIIDDPQSRKIYMVLEYTEGGAITWRDEHDRPVLTKKESKQMFKDIVNGLDYLHGLGIIHRDIKPANLLLTKDQRVKITDFGTSYDPSQDDPKLLMETVGTPAFFAPELCRHSTIPPTYSMDVWALGVTLYCFTFGKCPFMASTEFELFELIPTHPLSFPSSHDDPVLEELLLRLLTKDPISRITLQQVKVRISLLL